MPVMAARQAINTPINPTPNGPSPNIPQNGPNLNLAQSNRFEFKGSGYNYGRNWDKWK